MGAPAWLVPASGALGLAAGLAVFFSAFSRLWLRRRIKDTPTARLRSVAAGQSELKGLAAPLGAPLRAPYSGAACVWWRARVERYERASKGGGQWRLIHEGSSGAPFQLRDADAQLRVDPAGAEMEAPLCFQRRGSSAGALQEGGPFSPSLWGDHRYSEWRLDVDRPLYVLGVLRRGPEGASLGQGRLGEPFLISHQSEAELLSKLAWDLALRLGLGAALVLLSAWALSEGGMA